MVKPEVLAWREVSGWRKTTKLFLGVPILDFLLTVIEVEGY